jgi:hypothetical protein
MFFTQRTQSISQWSQRIFLTLRAWRFYPLRTLREMHFFKYFEYLNSNIINISLKSKCIIYIILFLFANVQIHAQSDSTKELSRFSLHFQSTIIDQYKLPFNAKIRGKTVYLIKKKIEFP